MAILQNIKNVIANGHKEAIKYIVSCGVITPEHQVKLEAENNA